MKFTLTLLQIFLILTLTSCGARKRTVDKSERSELIKNDIRLDSSFVKTIDIRLNDRTKEIIFEPVLLDAPMRVNNDTIYNTRVIYRDKVRDSIVYVKDSGNVYKIDNSEKRVEEKEKNTNTEYQGFNWKGLNWTLVLAAIILGLGIVIWLLLKRASKK